MFDSMNVGGDLSDAHLGARFETGGLWSAKCQGDIGDRGDDQPAAADPRRRDLADRSLHPHTAGFRRVNAGHPRRGEGRAQIPAGRVPSRSEITGCWANINPRGGLNTRHTHPNNFLSGTYYVQVPPEANRIIFDDPRPQAMTVLPRVKQYNKFVGNEVSFEIRRAASSCSRPGCRMAYRRTRASASGCR